MSYTPLPDPPDSTLVLVNGKRRHRGSVINFPGAPNSRGSQGADISNIPAIALERVEVLRDGAAAQYGSDAIAGVLNFKLREDTEGLTAQASWLTGGREASAILWPWKV